MILNIKSEYMAFTSKKSIKKGAILWHPLSQECC